MVKRTFIGAEFEKTLRRLRKTKVSICAEWGITMQSLHRGLTTPDKGRFSATPTVRERIERFVFENRENLEIKKEG